MLRPMLVGSLVAATLVVAVPAAAFTEPAKKAPPPADHGFPLEDYLRGLLKGKVFVGGAPPAFVGAKTKDAVFVVGGKAHYQPQVALRRAGRDDGKGRFLILRARSWGSAMAYVVKLDPGIVKLLRIAFPKAILGTKFPPLYAGITYSFAVSPESANPVYKPVQVASQPHPDPALRKKNVTLVTLKQGLPPGGYAIRLTAEVDLRPHPLKRLYEAYETVTGVTEWATIALAPGEVALEKLVDKGIEVLVDAAAEGDPRAIATLGRQATREKVAKKALENAVKSALTRTETVYRFEVPTIVPKLAGLTRARAEAALRQRLLRWTYRYELTSTAALVGTIKSQSIAAGQKRKVGTTVVLRAYVQGAAPAPSPPTAPPGTLAWNLTKTEINPLRGSPPPNSILTVRNGHIDWQVTVAPQADFDLDWTIPPSRLPAGKYTFAVRAAGRITGGTTTQGFRNADAIFLAGDRWDRQALGVAQNCYDPIGTAPITCTPPATNQGTFSVDLPTPRAGATFTFGVGALNCASCYVRYTYTAR